MLPARVCPVSSTISPRAPYSLLRRAHATLHESRDVLVRVHDLDVDETDDEAAEHGEDDGEGDDGRRRGLRVLLVRHVTQCVLGVGSPSVIGGGVFGALRRSIADGVGLDRSDPRSSRPGPSRAECR